jgi:hypothetical protein
MGDPVDPSSGLPKDAPAELRTFLGCTGASVTLKDGPIGWLKVSGLVPDSLKDVVPDVAPTLSITQGAGQSATVSVSIGPISLASSVPVSISNGQLSVDTSGVGIQSVADGIKQQVDNLNAWFKAHGKGLGPAVFGKGQVSLKKVDLAAPTKSVPPPVPPPVKPDPPKPAPPPAVKEAPAPRGISAEGPAMVLESDPGPPDPPIHSVVDDLSGSGSSTEVPDQGPTFAEPGTPGAPGAPGAPAPQAAPPSGTEPGPGLDVPWALPGAMVGAAPTPSLDLPSAYDGPPGTLGEQLTGEPSTPPEDSMPDQIGVLLPEQRQPREPSASVSDRVGWMFWLLGILLFIIVGAAVFVYRGGQTSSQAAAASPTASTPAAVSQPSAAEASSLEALPSAPTEPSSSLVGTLPSIGNTGPPFVIIAGNEISFGQAAGFDPAKVCKSGGTVTFTWKIVGIAPGTPVQVRLVGRGVPSSVTFTANPNGPVAKAYAIPPGGGSWSDDIVSIGGVPPPSSGAHSATVFQC